MRIEVILAGRGDHFTADRETIALDTPRLRAPTATELNTDYHDLAQAIADGAKEVLLRHYDCGKTDLCDLLMVVRFD